MKFQGRGIEFVDGLRGLMGVRQVVGEAKSALGFLGLSSIVSLLKAAYGGMLCFETVYNFHIYVYHTLMQGSPLSCSSCWNYNIYSGLAMGKERLHFAPTLHGLWFSGHSRMGSLLLARWVGSSTRGRSRLCFNTM